MRLVRCTTAAVAVLLVLPVLGATAQSLPDTPMGNTQTAPQSAVPPAPAVPAQGIIAPGRFEAMGVNPDGTTYRAHVVIRQDGETWRVSWLIGSGDTFSGVGHLAGGKLVVDWGQTYPVIYEPGPNGTLAGSWDNGRGKETLVPSK